MGKDNLYHYLIEHKEKMIEDWFNHETFDRGAFDSGSVSQSAEEMLSKQYQELIQGLADFLIQPEDDSRQHLIDWATKIAHDKVRSETTIVEWLTHFQSFSEIFWRDVSSYIKNTPSISKHTAILWADLFSSLFDTITKEFIKEYLANTESQLNAQKNIIDELNTPVISITNEIGVLPIVGELDEVRAQSILNSTLTQCMDRKVTHLCIDLSGVATMDTMVAQQIFKIITSLELIGVESTLSGMSPEIAQTAVQLGIDFKNISVQTTLQKALYNIGLKFES